ncbi:DNA translocase FtsK 4TM domain-containing protein [Ruminiclostridium josui]|uniref:DNA translocase FtsK 4TM domain-containing protein n=1 Tax=Ruminiclostridium josui TaxID=1499 RepID=UPI000B01E2C4
MQAKKVKKRKKYRRVESGFSKYKNEILGLILFAFGILSFFSFIFTKSMGVFGKGITNVMLGFLGVVAYVVPVVLIVYGVAMIFKMDSHNFRRRVIYFGILLVLLSAFIQVSVFDYEEYSGRGLFYSISILCGRKSIVRWGYTRRSIKSAVFDDFSGFGNCNNSYNYIYYRCNFAY